MFSDGMEYSFEDERDGSQERQIERRTIGITQRNVDGGEGTR